MRLFYFCLLVLAITGNNTTYAQGWYNAGFADTAVSTPSVWSASSDIATDSAGTPYVAFLEDYDSGFIRIRKFDGAAWADVGMQNVDYRGGYQQ